MEYHGGVYEEGKDIICHGCDEFGDKYITVVQVKKYNESVGAKEENTFSEIVTQLQQALEKEVACIDAKRLPRNAIFITPYSINARSLESRFEKYETLRSRGTKVIDGFDLAKLLVEKMPDYVARVLPDFVIEAGYQSGRLSVAMKRMLDNSPLMAALKSKSEQAVHDYYTDIDFSLGKSTTAQFFATSFKGGFSLCEPTLLRGEWDELKEVNEQLVSRLGVSVLCQPVSETELHSGDDWARYQKYKEVRVKVESLKKNIALQTEALGNIRKRVQQKVEDADAALKVCRKNIAACEAVLNGVSDGMQSVDSLAETMR